MVTGVSQGFILGKVLFIIFIQLTKPGKALSQLPVSEDITGCACAAHAARSAHSRGSTTQPDLSRHGPQINFIYSRINARSGPVASTGDSPEAKSGQGWEWPPLAQSRSSHMTETARLELAQPRQRHVAVTASAWLVIDFVCQPLLDSHAAD